MPSLKEIRNKISSVKSTKRIMQAMKMIATVKYAKTQVMISSFHSYFDAYSKIIKTVSKMSTKNGEKYLKPRESKNDLLILISSIEDYVDLIILIYLEILKEMKKNLAQSFLLVKKEKITLRMIIL